MMKNLLITNLLLLGTLNPKNVFEAIASAFLFTFLFFYFFDKKILFSVLLLVPFAFLRHNPLLLWMLTGSLPVIIFYSPFKIKLNKQPIYILFAIISLFLLSSLASYKSVLPRLKEPDAKTYFDDKLGFLRIYYLVEHGQNYYKALVKTHMEDARSSTVPQDFFSWRLPAHVYLWKLVPGTQGNSIYLLYLLFSSINLFLTYKISSIFIRKKFALLSPYLILPYFLYGSTTIEFLQTDWWALTPFLLGIYLLLKNKLFSSFLFFSMALVIRELFLTPYLGVLVFLFISRNFKKLLFSVIPLFILGVTSYLHFMQVASYVRVGLSSRGHGFDTLFINQSLSYGSIKYLLFELRPFLILLILSILFFLFNLRKNLRFTKILILSVFIAPMILYTTIGSSPYTDYWGITFVPFILSFAPIFIFTNEKSSKLPVEIKSSFPMSPSRYEGTILVLKQLKKYVVDKTKIIDVGYGKFYLISVLSEIEKKFTYTGVDIETYEITLPARNIKTIRADITNFQSAKKYNIATCLWVLEHIKDDKMALKSINRLLESRGILILTVPSIWSWPFELGRHGYHYYSRGKLLEEIQKAGFKVINFYSLGGMLGWLFMVLYSWPRYIFLILLLPSYILLSKIGFIKQNWKKFSSIAVSKTFYRYHKNKSAVLAHNTVISNLSRIDSFAKLFPSSYLLIAKKK